MTSETIITILFLALAVMFVLYIGEKHDNEILVEEGAMIYNLLSPAQKRLHREWIEERNELGEMMNQ